MENTIDVLKARLNALSSRWTETVNVQNATKIKVSLARQYRKQIKKLNVLLTEAKQATLSIPDHFMTEEDRVKARLKKG